MKRLVRALVVVAAVATSMAVVASPSVAQEGAPPSPADPSAPITDTALLAEIESATKGAGAAGAGTATVAVEILHDGYQAAVEAALAQAGGEVTGDQAPGVIQAAVPISSLNELALSDGVRYVRAPMKVLRAPSLPKPQVGARQTQAVSVVNADDWHAKGIKGANVKVGIVDFFYGPKYKSMMASGDVVKPLGARCFSAAGNCPDSWNTAAGAPGADGIPDPFFADARDSGGGHGNAVTETLIDVAPSAKVYLGLFDAVNDGYKLVDWFKSQGVTIMSSSLGWDYDGPGNGTGPLDALADYAASKGMFWVTAAGNEGAGNYARWTYADQDGDGYVEWPGNDEWLRLNSDVVYGQGLRWTDFGKPASQVSDYKLEFYQALDSLDSRGNPLPGAYIKFGEMNRSQVGGALPIELAGEFLPARFPDVVVFMRLKRLTAASRSVGDVFELASGPKLDEHATKAGSANSPISDSKNRNVLSIGAIGNNPFGTTIAPYSSQGPTNDGRKKPDVSAPTCFTSSVYAPGCFDGTSAATPVVAGVAALYSSAGLAIDNNALQAVVRRRVTDLGAAGHDNAFGLGRVNAGDTPLAVNSSPGIYKAITPIRMLDTRSAAKSPGVTGSMAPFSVIDYRLAGVAAPGVTPAIVPVPNNATAVAVNITVVKSAGAGFTQAAPYLAAKLGAFSAMNVTAAGATRPNFAIVPLGRGGKISLYSTSGGHYIIDVLGYFTPSAASSAGRLVAVDPVHVLSTSAAVAVHPELLPTGWADHQPVAGETVTYDFKDPGPLPATGVSAVVLTLQGTNPTANGFVTVYPTGGTLPTASSLNLTVGSVASNSIIVPLGTARSINVYTSGGAHIDAWLSGYITDATAPSSSSGRFVPVTPGRLYDSRKAPEVIFPAGASRTIKVAGSTAVAIPATGAAALSMNFTAAGQASGGTASIIPAGTTVQPPNVSWSAANFSVAAAGIVKLSTLAPAGRVAISPTVQAHLIVDANGYFTS